MKEFIEKLIGRLEEINHTDYGSIGSYESHVAVRDCLRDVKNIVNQIAEEHNNDFCEWEYDDFEDGWQTSCGTSFSLCDSDKEITHYCSYCGKKIKVVE